MYFFQLLSPYIKSAYHYIAVQLCLQGASCMLKNFSISPPRLAFLAWVDSHARSRFARSTIPEEKMGTTRSLTEI